jgi:hypothetical protein
MADHNTGAQHLPPDRSGGPDGKIGGFSDCLIAGYYLLQWP